MFFSWKWNHKQAARCVPFLTLNYLWHKAKSARHFVSYFLGLCRRVIVGPFDIRLFGRKKINNILSRGARGNPYTSGLPVAHPCPVLRFNGNHRNKGTTKDPLLCGFNFKAWIILLFSFAKFYKPDSKSLIVYSQLGVHITWL